jgi:hypothetical protein
VRAQASPENHDGSRHGPRPLPDGVRSSMTSSIRRASARVYGGWSRSENKDLDGHIYADNGATRSTTLGACHDPHHVFKRVVGETPIEYRER